MRQEGYGVPALLSLFFPGLGQLVKGHWARAVLVWVLLLAPWTVLGFLAANTARARVPFGEYDLLDIYTEVATSPFLAFAIACWMIVWIWAVVDAYRRPVE